MLVFDCSMLTCWFLTVFLVFLVFGGSRLPAFIVIDSCWNFILYVLPILQGIFCTAFSQLHTVASDLHVFRNCAISMRISIQFLQCNPVAVVYLCFHTPSVGRFKKRRWVMNLSQIFDVKRVVVFQMILVAHGLQWGCFEFHELWIAPLIATHLMVFIFTMSLLI